ncbi:MAG: response regulator [Acetobacteraceae bacterium]|nr:response regulator [Acetobacteraceae bacterium]
MHFWHDSERGTSRIVDFRLRATQSKNCAGGGTVRHARGAALMSFSGSPDQPLRILVAEDEPLAAMVVEEILLELGHEVTVAGDGQAALEIAESQYFDILVTDLAMPRMPGWELVPRLRAGRPQLPVVVMTGYLPPGVAATLEASGSGPLVLLQKPFDLGALIDAVAEVAPAPHCRVGHSAGGQAVGLR